MKLLLYLTAIAICDLLAIMSAKMWNLKGNIWYLIGSMFGFALTALFFALGLKYESTAILNIFWESASIILVTIFGYIYFKESLSLTQLIGIVIILFGIILMEIK